MGKLSRTAVRPATGGPVVTISRGTTAPDTTTHQGGAGFSRDVKSELFLLAVGNFVGEQTFYESADERDSRFLTLVNQATAEDPEWTANLLYWLRTEANMRSASIVGAIEYGRAVQGRTGVTNSARQVVESVIKRADEPGEALGYWLGRYGRPVPIWLKRALGSAAQFHYTPFNAFKYDGQSQPVRFADVVEYSQIKGDNVVWKWLLARRHNREDVGRYAESIPMLAARIQAEELPVEARRQLVNTAAFDPDSGAAHLIKDAGFTWESLSGWLQGPMDALAWQSVIPSMGYMALLRNLRNFDEAGVPDEVAARVMLKLTDPDQVKRSRQLPMRFLSAYNAAPSDRWKHALGHALDLSLASIPAFPGRTLVLIDTSGSMGMPFSKDGTLHFWEAAALFGIALAKSAAEVEVVSYSNTYYGGDSSKTFPLVKGKSVLGELDRFRSEYFIGGGTDTAGAVNRHYNGHDRVVLLTDEQVGYFGQSSGVFARVPDKVPCYTYNLAGYRAGHDISSPTRVTVGGLSDAGFKMMATLERHYGSREWPWEA